MHQAGGVTGATGGRAGGAWPPGGGEMGARVRAFDWSKTVLGGMEGWPSCLRAAVGICLTSRFPMMIWAGEGLVMIYNDAYAPFLGKRHPSALGKSGPEVWGEIWHVVGPQVDAVMRGGEATWNERVLLVMERNGFSEETWFTWSYSPILDDEGRVYGIFNTCREDTAQVLAERERDRLAEQRRMALDAANLGFWHMNPVTLELVFDARLLEFFGYPPGEGRVTFAQAIGSIHEEDRARVELAVRRAIDPRAPEPYGIEYRTVHGDGSVRRVFAHGRAYFAGEGEGRKLTDFVGTVADITEVKRAEEEKRALAERHAEERRVFDLVLSSITDFAYTFDLEGRFSFINKPLLDLWGLTLGEAVGKDFYELKYPAALAAKLQAEIQQVIRTRERLVGETEYTNFEGRTGYYEYIFSPVLGAEGAVIAVAGSTRDMTEQRRAAMRDRFLVSLDDAVRPLSDPTEITLTAARLLGEYLQADRCAYADVEADADTMNLTGNYMRGPGIKSIVGRMTFTSFGAEVLRLMRENLPYVVEDVETHRPAVDAAAYKATQIQAVICVPLHKDGKFVAAMAVHQATPRKWYPDEVELVRSVAARCWESIERARVERALRESEEFHRFAAEAGRTGSWSVNFETGECVLSPMAAEVLGYPREHRVLSAAEWRGRVVKEDLAGLEAAIAGGVAGGGVFECEFRIGLEDGSERWIYSRGAVARDGAGRAVRLHGASGDITERKRTEAERERLLAGERAARAEADAANRAKDKFLAVLSHELRTPLSPVVMTIPAMELDAEMPFKFREELAMVRRNIELEVKLIDDLLDLSRVTSGKLRLHAEAVRGHEVLRYAVQNSVSELPGKRIEIRQALLAGNDLLTADAARLQQVFWNLLRNAVKFSPEGGVVEVRTWNEGGRFFVEISDAGEGIPAEVLPRVFDAFEQGDARVTRQFGGLGLGLAIAKAVVEMHGGEIRAASAGRGKGATFTVEFQNREDAMPSELPKDGHMQKDGENPGAARILLVEDHADTAKTFARLLRGSGFVVKTADSVAGALETAGAEAFDVVVSDIGLPDATGYELMRELRRRHGLKGIALSGYGMEEDVRKSREAGFSEHMVKPVNLAQFEVMLRRVLQIKS